MTITRALPATQLAKHVAQLSLANMQSIATSPASIIPLNAQVDNSLAPEQTFQQVDEPPVSTAVIKPDPTPTTMNEKSGTTWVEINLPNSSTSNTAQQPGALTEAQKNQRALKIGSVVLVSLVILIYFINRSK